MKLGGEVTGTVRVGRFLFEVGSPQGTRAHFSPGQKSDSTQLQVALDQVPTSAGETEDILTRAEDAAGEIGSVVSKLERGLELITALSQGKVLDRKMLLKEVEILLALLERLDREKRYRDVVRVARVLAVLLALLWRVVALVETLRTALRAAQALGDPPGIAWAKHELGTLSLGAEDAHAASTQLNEALEIRKAESDKAGEEITRHNLHVLSQAFPGFGGGSAVKPLVLAGAVAAVALFAAGGVAIGMAVSGDRGDSTTAAFNTSTVPTDSTTDDSTTTTDTTPPVVTIGERPDPTTEERSATFTFEADEDDATFECRLDDRPFEECPSPKNFRGPLAPAPHTFFVRAVDPAGNESKLETFTWRIEESEGPAVEIVKRPRADITNITWAEFTFRSAEADHYDCSLDDRPFEPCPNPQLYSATPEGEHTLVVRAFNASGVRGPVASHTWTVDTTEPRVRILQHDFPGDGTVRFPFESREEITARCVVRKELLPPNDPVVIATVEKCSSPLVFEVAEGESYIVEITPTDLARNTGATARTTLEIPFE